MQVLATFSAGFAKQVGVAGVAVEEEADLPSVEAVGLSPTNPLAVTGSLSGVLGIWDIPTQKLRQKCIHKVMVSTSKIRIKKTWALTPL